MKRQYEKVQAYETKDGSEIRELAHPDNSSAVNQSLAEAIVFPGQITRLHKHEFIEEIYHVTSGRGDMRLGEQVFMIETGDTVVIPPGTPHQLINDGLKPLKVLCCCSPAYTHDDTLLLD